MSYPTIHSHKGLRTWSEDPLLSDARSPRKRSRCAARAMSVEAFDSARIAALRSNFRHRPAVRIPSPVPKASPFDRETNKLIDFANKLQRIFDRILMEKPDAITNLTILYLDDFTALTLGPRRCESALIRGCSLKDWDLVYLTMKSALKYRFILHFSPFTLKIFFKHINQFEHPEKWKVIHCIEDLLNGEHGDLLRAKIGPDLITYHASFCLLGRTLE